MGCWQAECEAKSSPLGVGLTQLSSQNNDCSACCGASNDNAMKATSNSIVKSKGSITFTNVDDDEKEEEDLVAVEVGSRLRVIFSTH